MIRDVPGHITHFHLRFKDPNNIKSQKVLDPVAAVDINKLEFYNGNGWKIRPRENYKSEFDDKYILWRFQDQRGFKNDNLKVGFGQWPEDQAISKDLDSFAKKATLSPLYGYVVVAERGTGLCSCYRVDMDTEDDIIVAGASVKDIKNRSNCYE